MHDRRPPSLLMRQMDDFLVLSRDRGLVEAFLKVIHTRIGEFGLIVQARKTMTSYRSDVMSELSDLSTHTGGHELAWNGLIICARTLSVRADHRRYLDRDVRDWLSLKALSGTALNAAFKRFIVPRSQAVLLDEAVCCKAVVARNVYEVSYQLRAVGSSPPLCPQNVSLVRRHAVLCTFISRSPPFL